MNVHLNKFILLVDNPFQTYKSIVRIQSKKVLYFNQIYLLYEKKI